MKRDNYLRHRRVRIPRLSVMILSIGLAMIVTYVTTIYEWPVWLFLLLLFAVVSLHYSLLYRIDEVVGWYEQVGKYR